MRTLSTGFIFGPFSTLAVALSLTLNGCSTGGPHLFHAGPGARFGGVSEQQVLEQIQRHCATLSVGDQSLGALLKNDAAFRTLTLGLYRGEMSNDEYVDRVMALRPAADGNVPATGCVITQFNQCISGNCKRKQSSERESAAGADDAPVSKQVAMPVARTRAGASEMSQAPKLEAGL